MPIEYACVAQRGIILSDEGDRAKFRSFIDKMLGELSEKVIKQRKSYEFEGWMFYLIQDGEFIYMCVAGESFNDKIAFVFLEKVVEKFQPSMSSDRFGPVLRELIAMYSSDKDFEKIAAIKSELEQVKTVMRENLEKAFERGEWLNELEGKTAELDFNTGQFRRRTKDLKTAFCMKNVKLYITLGVVILSLILIIVFLICGITFQNCIQPVNETETSQDGNVGFADFILHRF
eukprot:TRINITY_DN93_c0_g2_i1.p1 TRINITY_DN93_c0_g2~~TRINITY_DN93_c0_g2_i1.p1  ORF type:complete len:240 (-),score=47.18 TRINITY_DN93_c0_g2_i1:32-727(-)